MEDTNLNTTQTTEATATEQTATAATETKAETVKTFTQDDINRIVAKTKAEEQRKREADIANARSEGEKFAALTAEQKAQAIEKERQETLSKREAEITRRELRAQTLEQLAERQLPRELADLINYTDASTCDASIQAAEKAFRNAVQAGVNDMLKGSAPKTSRAAPNYKDMSDADYYAATYGKKV